MFVSFVLIIAQKISENERFGPLARPNAPPKANKRRPKLPVPDENVITVQQIDQMIQNRVRESENIAAQAPVVEPQPIAEQMEFEVPENVALDQPINGNRRQTRSTIRVGQDMTEDGPPRAGGRSRSTIDRVQNMEEDGLPQIRGTLRTTLGAVPYVDEDGQARHETRRYTRRAESDENAYLQHLHIQEQRPIICHPPVKYGNEFLNDM